ARRRTNRAARLRFRFRWLFCRTFSTSIRPSLPPCWRARNQSRVDARMRSLDEFATAKLAELERSSLRRALVDTTRVTGIWLLRNGRRLLSFSCNDYLNLTHHPAVKDAAIEALRVYGLGAGASRLVTGNHPLAAGLEGRAPG